jgi:hypothetical protein
MSWTDLPTRAIAVFGSRVFLAWAGATRKPLTWKIREVAQVILVTRIGQNIWYTRYTPPDPDIICVVCGGSLRTLSASDVPPLTDWDTHRSFQARAITSSKFSPSTRPQATDQRPSLTRNSSDSKLEVPSRKTELVPTVYRATLIVQVMGLLPG